MSAKEVPGKRRWGKTVGLVLFWGASLSFLAYQIAQDRWLAKKANPEMAEICAIFDRAIEEGVAPPEARWNYTISKQDGTGYVIRYTLQDGCFDYYLVSLDWEGWWSFDGGAGGREGSFIRDRMQVE